MRYDLFSHKSIIIVLMTLSVVVHALWFGQPNSAVFDEVHFGKFITAYFTHEYYFDIHPPLGKLIVAGWGWLWGYTPGFSFATIGEVYPDNLYMALRLLPTLAGLLLPLVIYGIGRRLRLSNPAAFLAGLFVVLDNALLVQSRLILLDSFLLLFGFGAIYFWLRYRDTRSFGTLALSGALAGAAMCIKWTGISFIALIVLWESIDTLKNIRSHGWKASWPDIRLRAAFLIILPLLSYLIPFIAHLSLLSKSGAGDAFMSARFQHELIGSRYENDATLTPISTLEKIIELNTEMYRANQRLTATHPYASAWHSWPLMMRPIFYWTQNTSRIYLIGNPLVWWASTAGVIALLLTVVFSRFHAVPRTPLFLLSAWLANILPFVGITRVMFLYHYFTALIWAILMLAYIIDGKPQHTRKTVLALGGVALACFIFFAPLSYGLPMSDAGFSMRAWLTTWR